MCSRTTCSTCNKPTWSGCGAHVEQALRGVAPEARCRCREESAQPTQRKPDWLGDLFGRSRR